MSLGFAVGLRNSRLDQLTAFYGASALLRIYSGTRPATGGALSGNTLLAQLTLGAVLAAAASSGTLTLNSISPQNSAAATGQATWFRIVKADGTTFCTDGGASTVAQGTGELRLDDTNIIQGGTVAVSSGVVTDGNP